MLKITIILGIVILTILLVSCSSPTEAHTGDLTGFVLLENQQDHSGIVVALYELAYLDTTIVRINNTYPHIGVNINQHTEFDHRMQSPVRFTETLVDGSFNIDKIPTGQYNVVAIKNGWGFKYLYEILIEHSDNNLTTQPELYEEKVISEYFDDQNNFFLSDHHYVIEDDTELLPNQCLEIQPGSVVRINPGKDFTIHGSLKAQGEEDNMFWVTSNNGFGEELIQFDSIQFYNEMELSSIASVENDLIEWGKWSWGNTSFHVQGNIAYMLNGIYRDSYGGFSCANIDSIICQNLLCEKIKNQSLAGIYYNFNTSGKIENNIISYSNIGIRVKNSSDPIVKNNYLFDSNVSIEVSLYSDPIIENNEICYANIGMIIQRNCLPLINYNVIKSDIGISESRNPLILQYNNLDCIDYAIELLYSDSSIGVDVQAENNYFYTIDLQSIASLIFDQNDVIASFQNNIGIVDFEPFLFEECTVAGVQ